MSSYPTEVEVQAAAVAQVEVAALRRELVSKQLEADRALALIVERMRNLTGATGAAIALAAGAEIVCRASSGNAPAVGAPINPDSGLSGECLRTGQLVRCEDTDTDSRADRAICRAMQIRSILILPLPRHDRPQGVLEVFSSEPRAFEPGDELALRQIAELVAEIAGYRPVTSPDAGSEPVVIDPELKDQVPAKTDKEQAVPVISIVRVAEPSLARIAAKQPKPSAVILQLPVRLEKPAETSSPASERTVPSPAKVRAIGAGIVLVLVAAGLWLGLRAGNSENSASNVTQPKPAPAAAAPVISQAPPRRAIETVTVRASEPPSEPKPQKQVAPITLARANVASAPSALIVLDRSADTSPISSLLNAPVAEPHLEAAKVSQTSGGKLLKKVEPIYPRLFTQSASGEVVLKATINRKGEVSKVKLVSGPAVLAQAAIAAVTHWRYEPFRLNGDPIEVENDIVVNFKAPGK
jgi:TonB family protein